MLVATTRVGMILSRALVTRRITAAVDPDGADLGPTARAVMPHFAQLFVAETMGARADEKAFGGGRSATA